MIVKVLGAAGPAGVNTCRALCQAGHDVVAHDDRPDRLPLVERWANTGYQGDPDVVWAQPDKLVFWLSERRNEYLTLLPAHDVLAKCWSKWRTAKEWAKQGIRQLEPVDINQPTVDWLHVAKDKLGLPFWLRDQYGAGARAATPVYDLRTAHHWIRYWQTRGVKVEWVAEEYLPGPDYCWTSLWYQGDLVAAFTRRRDEWLYPQLSPSGITGTPTKATIVHDKIVKAVARDALLAIDPEPHGAYALDLREDKWKLPRPTEINAGRWPTTTGLWAEIGPNLPDMAVRLAAGETVEPLGEDIYPAGVTMHRHIDCPAVFTRTPVAAA